MTTRLLLLLLRRPRALVRPAPPHRPLAALAAWLLEEPPGAPTAAQRARIAQALRFAPPH